MITPLIMLALMTGPWLLAKGWERLVGRAVDARAAAAIGLGMMFVFTGIGHFAMTDAMVQMLPAWVPERLWLVYATGILEFLIAVGLFLPRTRRVAGWTAAAVLVLFFPANVYAAFNHVPMGGHSWGPVYLLVRVPLQTVALLWAWWFTIRHPSAVHIAFPGRGEA